MSHSLSAPVRPATQRAACREPAPSSLREAFDLLCDRSLELDREGNYRDGEAMQKAATYLATEMIKRGEMRSE